MSFGIEFHAGSHLLLQVHFQASLAAVSKHAVEYVLIAF